MTECESGGCEVVSWKASTPRPVAASGMEDFSDPIGCLEYGISGGDSIHRRREPSKNPSPFEFAGKLGTGMLMLLFGGLFALIAGLVVYAIFGKTALIVALVVVALLVAAPFEAARERRM